MLVCAFHMQLRNHGAVPWLRSYLEPNKLSFNIKLSFKILPLSLTCNVYFYITDAPTHLSQAFTLVPDLLGVRS